MSIALPAARIDIEVDNRTDERGYNQVWKSGAALKVRTARRAELLGRSLDVPRNGRILEIGSGLGAKAALVASLTGCHVTGLDLSMDFTERARLANLNNDAVTFVRASVSELASETPGTYDAVFGDGILHHLVYDLDRSLGLLKRLLRPGGTFAFLEPNKANPYVFGIFNLEVLRRITKLEPDEMAFSRTFIHTKLVGTGFANVAVSYRDFLVPGTPHWAVRPAVALGSVAERTPVVRALSQSLLITGSSSI